MGGTRCYHYVYGESLTLWIGRLYQGGVASCLLQILNSKYMWSVAAHLKVKPLFPLFHSLLTYCSDATCVDSK